MKKILRINQQIVYGRVRTPQTQSSIERSHDALMVTTKWVRYR